MNKPITGKKLQPAIEEMLATWEERNRYRLLFYDLVASFSLSGEPVGDRRLVAVGRRPSKELGNSAWRAGKDAVDALLSMFQVGDTAGARDLTIQELSEFLPDLMEQSEDFLDSTFYPDLVANIKAGVISANGPLESFVSYWQQYTLVSKVEVFLDLLSGAQVAMHDEDFSTLVKKFAAVAVLVQLDDCVLASIDGSPNDGEQMIRVERLRQFVLPPKRSALDPGLMRKLALSDFNSKMARRRHQKTNDARDWIREEWATHSAGYLGNKSEFSRHYVRRLKIEREVEITEKTIREVWLKDTPSASNPPCLPADGE